MKQKFILFGRSRSGTTITFKILQAHSEINITNQAHKYLDNDFFGGDKIETPPLNKLERLSKDKDFKFIHIYRDGRDSVSSGMRMNKVFGKEYRPWKDMNPKINSKHWADAIFRWEEAKKFIPQERRIDIKFEDYLDFPGKNSEFIADLLVIGKDELVIIEKKLVKPDESHRGYYKKWVPDWEISFHSKALEALRLLNYIS
jgi:hypothetical protein